MQKSKPAHHWCHSTNYRSCLLYNPARKPEEGDFLQWLQALVNECQIKGIANNELAIVIGNAPTHCRGEDIVETNSGVHIIRLGPYSPALNGIEACWSDVKSAIKRQLSARQAELFEAPPEITQVAHRF